MKKLNYLLLFVLLLPLAVSAQTGWVTTKLDDRLSVKFPVEPQKTVKNGFNVYIYRAPDSLAYSATVIDFMVVANKDSAALAPVKDNPQFAEQLKMGMASSKPNYAFGDIKIGQWGTYTTYSVLATEKTNNNTLLMKMILIGSKMYSMSCRVPANLVTKNSDLYLSSAELLKK